MYLIYMLSVLDTHMVISFVPNLFELSKFLVCLVQKKKNINPGLIILLEYIR